MDDLKAYIKDQKLPFNPLVDNQKQTKWAFKANIVPTAYLIDKEGIIRIRALGWSDTLQQYLNEELVGYIW